MNIHPDLPAAGQKQDDYEYLTCSAIKTTPDDSVLPNFFDSSERIQNIRAELFDENCSICLERPLLIEKFRKTPHGRQAIKKEHFLVKRALTLAHVLSSRKPRIYNHELIVGNMSSKRIAANYYQEGVSINILTDIFRLEDRAVPLKLKPLEKIQLIGIAARSIFSSVASRLFLLKPWRLHILFKGMIFPKRYFLTEQSGISHQIGGYWNIVRHGLQRADKISIERLESGKTEDGTILTENQTAFYKSSRIVIQGIRDMAKNLASEAEKFSLTSGISSERKEELLKIAAACRQVPYKPARNLQEGLQACWLIHVTLNIEDYEQGLSFGRLDQILYPLYLQDIQTGRLTHEKAVELIASFQLKACETIPLFNKTVDKFFKGNTVGQGITLGGTDTKGNDVTNELSGLFLDAFAQIRTREPNLHARIHEKTPDWFLDRCAELLQLDCGSPSLFGDSAIISALKKSGMKNEDANDYAVIGCVEIGSQGRTYHSSDAALFNMPICLELALNQGRQFKNGVIGKISRLGAATIPVEAMTCFEDVINAYREQIKDSVDEAVKATKWIERVHRVHRTSPVNSIITEGCLEKGKDVTWGGAVYDYTSFQSVGMADVGDSLYAINKLVFEDKRYTLSELVDILKNNFKGHNPLRVEIAGKFSKYGNGNPKVDKYTQISIDAFTDAVCTHRNSRGGKYLVGVYSMTCNVGYGEITGALPNGRLAGTPLSNGIAPANGADRNGPTALLRSAASLDNTKWANGCNLNVKFEKKMVQGKTGKMVLKSLFKSYLIDQKGMQAQINVLDAETLIKARKDPLAFPGLLVRVAGYCAYFKDLDPDTQDEIINRTAHGAR
jgi:formate C-acetyltransferase